MHTYIEPYAKCGAEMKKVAGRRCIQFMVDTVGKRHRFFLLKLKEMKMIMSKIKMASNYS